MNILNELDQVTDIELNLILLMKRDLFICLYKLLIMLITFNVMCVNFSGFCGLFNEQFLWSTFPVQSNLPLIYLFEFRI